MKGTTSQMVALEMLAKIAVERGDRAQLAVVEEAWVRAGWGIQWLAPEDTPEAMRNPRHRRNRAKLRQQAEQMLATLDMMPLDLAAWQRIRWRQADGAHVVVQAVARARASEQLDVEMVKACKVCGAAYRADSYGNWCHCGGELAMTKRSALPEAKTEPKCTCIYCHGDSPRCPLHGDAPARPILPCPRTEKHAPHAWRPDDRSPLIARCAGRVL